MNRLLTILLLAAGTAYGQIDNPPTSANIADATAIGRSLLTTASPAAGRGFLGGTPFGGSIFAGTSASARPTLIASILGFSVTNNLGFDASLTNFWTATNAATAATAIGLGTTNNVTFNELTATGNVTLSGVNNTATAQTADSASSLMTRDLSDDRYRLFYVPLVHVSSSTAANGSTWNLRPFHSADAAFSAPPWARNVRINLSTGFTNAPITNNFTAVITAFPLTASNGFGVPYTTTTNALSVTQVWSNGSNSYRFILRMTNDLALPSGGISDAESAGFWNILIQLRNDSSGSLTTVPDNWLRGMAVFTD